MQNILLIQNDDDEANVVRDALANSSDGSFRVTWVRHCSGGIDALGADRYAAVLVDLSLPDSSGIETFDRLFLAAPQIPILILAVARDEGIAQLAVQRGAQEYLLNERFDAYLWPKAVTRMIERAASTEALFQQNERAQVTLNSIGDAVVSTDVAGN
ncbi:MAG: hypothetical protein QOD95_356, partial [Gammaproteobacteria bacterium]|nr:hypothetical protein [Gammaproteobacteria bacterium]